MILDEDALRQAIGEAREAFPNFSHWQWNNKVNAEYGGVAIWGEFMPRKGEPCFYVTFSAYGDHWDANLTVGQHSFYWSSANEGDATLLSTRLHKTLKEAIQALKLNMKQLFTYLLPE